MFSKKMPTLVCKKHRLQLEFVEIKAYEPKAQEKLQKLEQFRQQHGLDGLGGRSFENNKKVVVVEDGDVIEIDEDEEVRYAEPEMCLKYD
jgi:hypothetical protein